LRCVFNQLASRLLRLLLLLLLLMLFADAGGAHSTQSIALFADGCLLLFDL